MQVGPKILAFDDFSCVLAEADSLANPAEIHGILCGLICSGQKIDGKFWFHTVLKLFESRAHIAARHRSMVIDLYDASCRQLSGLDSEFQMLLPDSNQSLSRRAEALSQWCQGFLFGLRLPDSSIEKEASEETRDALRCISELAQLDFASIEIREVDNKAYSGVVEFVRSAVSVLYEEFTESPKNQVKH